MVSTGIEQRFFTLHTAVAVTTSINKLWLLGWVNSRRTIGGPRRFGSRSLVIVGGCWRDCCTYVSDMDHNKAANSDQLMVF